MITAREGETEAQKFAESENRWSSAFRLHSTTDTGHVCYEIQAS
jgi:hypothetical protein